MDYVCSGRIFSMRWQKNENIERKLNIMLQWVEEKSIVTLRELNEKVQAELRKGISTTTIANNLNGRMYTMKNLHHEPIVMNHWKISKKDQSILKTLTH